MKKIILLMFVCMLGLAYSSKATSLYQIDDAAIEATLNMATSIAPNLSDAAALMNPFSVQASSSDKNAWIAVILDLIIGGLAIHRVYLGGTPMLIVYYLITCGGIFGVVPLVDLIVLIINNNDISRYVGSNKFFMWG